MKCAISLMLFILRNRALLCWGPLCPHERRVDGTELIFELCEVWEWKSKWRWIVNEYILCKIKI
jgi:hypothetical protein